jgi:hypothetical protein
MVLDQQLATLHKAASARTRSLSQLNDLATPDAEGLDPMTEARAILRYNQWADARRAEINLKLASQTAEWLQAREDAARALGRSEVLRTLSQRKKT